MNWHEKIKSITEKDDGSPKLKPGEIKNILLVAANRSVPDFQFLSHKGKTYTFLRMRQAGNFKVYEILHILFSLKEGNLDCSVASRLNAANINYSSYDRGMVNPHISLKKSVPIEESYYFHNGQLETTTQVVAQIFEDIRKIGIPFFDKQFSQLNESEILKQGLAYVSRLLTEGENFKSETALRSAHSTSVNPTMEDLLAEDLKETLQAIPGQTREDRKQIQGVARDLIKLYYNLAGLEMALAAKK